MAQFLAALFVVLIHLVGLSESSEFGSPSMPPTILTLQMIIDYAVDERWKEVILFDCIGNDGLESFLSLSISFDEIKK